MDAASRRAMFVYGAFGGILPTLATLASTYVANPSTPLSAIGLYFGLALWAIVGGGIALTNSTPEARLAIFAGIAAPAIISSLVSGASDAALHRKTASTFQHVEMMISRVGATIIQVANAEDKLNGDNLRPFGEGQIIPAQGQSTGPTLLVSSRVDGGNPSTSIPITVQIKNGEKIETVTIGTLSAFNGVSAYSLPTGTTNISMLGKTIPVSIGTITPANVVIKTKPSSVGDFLWSLGAPRAFQVQDASVSLAK